LIKPKVEVIGKVRIDYTDPLTGRVKELIEDHNHVYLDAFNIPLGATF
jgi:hypothetical protein